MIEYVAKASDGKIVLKIEADMAGSLARLFGVLGTVGGPALSAAGLTQEAVGKMGKLLAKAPRLAVRTGKMGVSGGVIKRCIYCRKLFEDRTRPHNQQVCNREVCQRKRGSKNRERYRVRHQRQREADSCEHWKRHCPRPVAQNGEVKAIRDPAEPDEKN